MINAISGYNPYSTYGSYYTNKLQNQAAEKAQYAQRSQLVNTARKVHQPETPVQPVTPARAINPQEDPAQAGLARFNSDPAEMAVRMRIQYPGQQDQAAEQVQNPALTGVKDNGQELENPVLGQSKAAENGKIENPVLEDAKAADAQKAENPALEESKSAQEVMEEGECQTCKERKYQDGSDDPGVSFKTPTNISPEQAASAVRGHENEHVVREQAKAQQEGRKVVSQSVTYHTDICPECGKAYVSGGETRTVTKADNSQQAEQQNQQQANQQDPRKPYSVVA